VSLKVILKIKWVFVILLSVFVIRHFRGTRSSVEMLKGYMVREMLGSPGLVCCKEALRRLNACG